MSDAGAAQRQLDTRAIEMAGEALTSIKLHAEQCDRNEVRRQADFARSTAEHNKAWGEVKAKLDQIQVHYGDLDKDKAVRDALLKSYRWILVTGIAAAAAIGALGGHLWR